MTRSPQRRNGIEWSAKFPSRQASSSTKHRDMDDPVAHSHAQPADHVHLYPETATPAESEEKTDTEPNVQVSSSESTEASPLQRPSQLDHWLSGAPIALTTPSVWRQTLQWCAGHRLVAVVLAINAAVVFGGALLVTAAYVRTSVALKAACCDRLEAEEQCDLARAISTSKAKEALESYRRAEGEKQARLAVESTLRQSQQRREELESELAEAVKRHLDSAKEARLLIAQALADDAAQRMNTQPVDALLLAAVSARATMREGAAPSLELQTTLRDALNKVGPPGASIPSSGLPAMAISSDGRWLTTGSESKTLRLWSPASQDPNASPWDLPGCHDDVLAVAFDAGGHRLAAVTSADRVLVWELNPLIPPTTPRTFVNALRRVTSTRLSPNGRWLAVCGKRDRGDECCTLLWDLTSTNRALAPRALTSHREAILASTFSPDDRWFITAGEDKTIHLWDTLATPPATAPIVLEGHQGWVDSLSVTHTGRWLISGSTDGAARLWKLDEMAPGAKSLVLCNRPSWITSMAVSADDRWLATGHFDNSVLLWDLTASDPTSHVIVLAGHTDHVRAVAFSPNGQSLITAAQDKTVRLWNLAHCDPAPRTVVLATQEESVDLLAVTGDNRWLVTISDCAQKTQTATIRLWAIGTSELIESAQLVATRRLPLPQRTKILQEAATRNTRLR